jgi:hypothetical protein
MTPSTLQAHVTSLVTSQRLKDAGVEQDSEYYWMKPIKGTIGYSGNGYVLGRLEDFGTVNLEEWCSAFLASELPFVLRWCNKCLSTNLVYKNSQIKGSKYCRFICRDCGHRWRGLRINFIVNPDTQCWIWVSAKNDDGYGVLQQKGNIKYAYKAFYEKFIGKVPQGKELDHLCKNRACVNPFHLEAVTHAENNRRGKNTKLSRVQIEEIRSLSGKKTQREVGKMYGISHVHVGSIWKNLCWKY